MAKFKCSWCGVTWQDKSKLPMPLQGGDVSHGICKACAVEQDRILDEQLAQSDAISKAITGEKKL